MLPTMKHLGGSLIVLGIAACAFAEPEAESKAVPGVDQAIPPRIAKLEAPEATDFKHGIVMAVGTPSDLAQKHVLLGLNHLHGGWEFQASRHFATAMKADPDCLLAHWGMAMAILDSSPENASARKAVIDRLIALLEAGQRHRAACGDRRAAQIPDRRIRGSGRQL